jgi:hypothetical protein
MLCSHAACLHQPAFVSFNPQGWATIKKGLAERLAAGKLTPAEVEACVVALHKSRNYDRDLFEGFSKLVKVRTCSRVECGLSWFSCMIDYTVNAGTCLRGFQRWSR